MNGSLLLRVVVMSTTRCNKITTRCSLREYVHKGLPYVAATLQRAATSDRMIATPARVPGNELLNAVVTTTIQLRFDRDSNAVRLPFDCNSTTYVMTVGPLAAALRSK